MEKGTFKTYLNGGFFLIQQNAALAGFLCCPVASVE